MPRPCNPKNGVSLADALASIAEPRAVLSPSEAIDLLLANGYQTRARSFGVMVCTTMSRDPRWKKIGHGQYERVNP